MDKNFLKEMLRTVSVSGDEIRLQKKVIAHMKEYASEICTDYTGNVMSVLNPESPVRVMLSGHIDEIGLMVTQILENGMIKVAAVGGIKLKEYPGHKVCIWTENGPIYGMVLSDKEIYQCEERSAEKLTIDIGADSKKEAEDVVHLGDSVVFDTDIRDMMGDKFCARAADNRAGAFIVLEALKQARERGCKNGVYAVTSTGEETTKRGAFWAASSIKPTLAIAVDVTYATDYEGTNPAQTGDVKLGKGPVLCNSTIINRKLNALLKKAAERAEIPYQIEAAVANTGTDIDRIHFSVEGVPTALVSLPLRYMHSPAEVGSYKDIQACIDLIAEFLLIINERIDLDPFL